MKLNALLAAAAALCCAAGAAQADPFADHWLSDARHKLDQKLAAAGIAGGEQKVDIEMRIDGDGQLYNPHIVSQTGSRDLDAAITKAVRRVDVGPAPAVLAGRAAVFHITVAPVRTAGLPAQPTAR